MRDCGNFINVNEAIDGQMEISNSFTTFIRLRPLRIGTLIYLLLSIYVAESCVRSSCPVCMRDRMRTTTKKPSEINAFTLNNMLLNALLINDPELCNRFPQPVNVCVCVQ